MYFGSTRLADVIFDDFTIIPVLNRFGISLGVGDMDIESVCRDRNIDTEFFLMIVNVCASDGYIPDTALSSVNYGVEEVLSYLDNTNEYYASVALPNIERHFRALQDRSVNGSNNIEFLWMFFQELKKELLGRIDSDKEIWFPAVRRVIASPRAESSAALAEIVASVPKDEKAIEDKVDDFTSFFVIHLRGEYDQNLCMAVVTSLMSLEKDIKRNDRIRERLLRPLSVRLSEGVSK